jgi:hypothetical protein
MRSTVLSHLSLLSFLVLFAGALACPAPGQDLIDDSAYASRWTPLEGTTPAQVRVVWTERPDREALVIFSSAEGREGGVVHWARRNGEAATEAPLELDQTTRCDREGPYTLNESERGEDAPPAPWHHRARLSGLRANTVYEFECQLGESRSRRFHFRTAPETDAPITFVYGGDSRTGWKARCEVNLAIGRLAERDELLCFVHGGDYVTHGDRWFQWNKWLSHHELTVPESGRLLPIVPARGNHDYGEIYAQVFGYEADRRGIWFETRLSPRVSLVNLDTNVSAYGPQLEWLKATLKTARADARWLLTNYHRPCFPAVKQPGEHAVPWVPEFERHDVDVAFESDGHVFKRTPPIRDGKPDESGIVYLGEGGLGVPQRRPRQDDWWLAQGVTAAQHHVHWVELTDASFRARTLVIPDPFGSHEELEDPEQFAGFDVLDDFQRQPRHVGPGPR